MQCMKLDGVLRVILAMRAMKLCKRVQLNAHLVRSAITSPTPMHAACLPRRAPMSTEKGQDPILSAQLALSAMPQAQKLVSHARPANTATFRVPLPAR